MLPPNTEPEELPPNILPPLVCDGALVVDILAAANRLLSAPPNREVLLCAVVVGVVPNTEDGLVLPNTEAWVVPVDTPNTEVCVVGVVAAPKTDA